MPQSLLLLIVRSLMKCHLFRKTFPETIKSAIQPLTPSWSTIIFLFLIYFYSQHLSTIKYHISRAWTDFGNWYVFGWFFIAWMDCQKLYFSYFQSLISRNRLHINLYGYQWETRSGMDPKIAKDYKGQKQQFKRDPKHKCNSK